MAQATTRERMAVLETEVGYVKKHVGVIEASQRETLAAVQALQKDLARYRGAWGAVVMVVTAVFSVVSVAINWFRGS